MKHHQQELDSVFILITILFFGCSSEPTVGTTHVPNLLKGSVSHESTIYLLTTKNNSISNVVDYTQSTNGEYSFNLSESGSYNLYAIDNNNNIALYPIEKINPSEGATVDIRKQKSYLQKETGFTKTAL